MIETNMKYDSGILSVNLLYYVHCCLMGIKSKLNIPEKSTEQDFFGRHKN